MLAYSLLIIFLLAFALLLLQAKRLITVSIALASLSALTASLLYLGGASTAAVIELSVGAGLVAVLFAFTNSLLAERNDNLGFAMPRIVGLVFAGLLLLLLLLNSLGIPATEGNQAENFSHFFWEERGADVLALMALMFTTILGVLALLAERETVERRAHESA